MNLEDGHMTGVKIQWHNIMNIQIKTIPHNEQRYDTVGDWWWTSDGNLEVRISDMKNWKYEFLVAFHELAEVMLCKDRNISQESVDSFDIEFEKNRIEGNIDEPGNSDSAPYQKEHKFATQIEYLMSQELGVDYNDYDNTINNL